MTWATSYGYKTGLAIDRINSDGNYTPENRQFVSRSENARKAYRQKPIKRKYENYGVSND
jgi:hypothetical protein